MFDQIEADSELDFVIQMRRARGDAVAIATMRNHWARYLDEGMLDTAVALGVNAVRVPVGYWIVDAPVGGSSHAVFAPVFARIDQSAAAIPLTTAVLTFGGVDGTGELRDLTSRLDPRICPADSDSDSDTSARQRARVPSRKCIDCAAGTRAPSPARASRGSAARCPPRSSPSPTSSPRT